MPSDDPLSNLLPDAKPRPLGPRREWLHEVIFEAETPAGKAFDLALLVAIMISVLAVMLDSVKEIHDRWGDWLLAVEWLFTVLFSVEYAARLICVRRPWRYAVSFFGIVDLAAIVPTYLSIFIAGSNTLLVIRTLRLIRVFRVLHLTHHYREARALVNALRATRARITVFLVFLVALVLILGSAMYLIEGNEEGTGFTSIPRSVYWAIVTMTTVGYGDIAPQTVAGQMLAAAVMILGYCIIIVPIGVFSVEIAAARHREISTQACPSCSVEGHDADAVHCKRCGEKL
ncbi:MAG: ion transporter [Candidatus Nealsonbacteria bacterium]|nr:ion transporter [Candidatus Nealsonbacteria bacterium]